MQPVRNTSRHVGRAAGRGAACAILLLVAGKASAQMPSIPTPSVITPDVRLEELPTAPQPGLPPAVAVPERIPGRVPAGAEAIRFVLNGLILDGVSAYPSADLEQAFAAKIGTEIALAEVFEIANEIQRRYRDDGYFLTRVIVPRQEAADGVLRLQVIEGFISQVTIQGDIGPVRRKVEQYLGQVVQERPLRLATLERALLLANDIPGVSVVGNLRPGRDDVGAAELVAEASRKWYDALALVDNIGTSLTGKWEVALSGSLNSFTQEGERLSLTGLLSDPPNGFSDNQKVLQAAGSLRPGEDGWYVNAFLSYGDSNPGAQLAQFGLNSETILFSSAVGYPLIRSRELNLYAEFGFDYIDSETSSDFIFAGEDLFETEDRNRVLHLDLRGDFLDTWNGASTASVSLRQGVPIFNTTRRSDPKKSRVDGSGLFTAFNGALSRHQGVIDDVAVFAQLSGQYAFNSLLSDEEFSLGGLRFGRGYDPKELSGDHGLGATAEVQYTREIGHEYFDRFQLFGFFDYGRVWDRGSSLTDDLCSSGGGVRAWPIDGVTLELLGAKPICRESLRADDSKETQVLFRAFARF